jgi:integrase
MTRLLSVARGDWRTLILLGFYSGGRLGDLARLRWNAVDLVERTLSFTQRKTDTKVKIPIHPQLHEALLALPAPDRSDAPLLPTLYDKPGTGRSGLSMTFRKIMTEAGIDGGIAREKKGARGRNVSRLSFHSLRHSFNSVLANAGVPVEVRQLLTGHSSADMNAVYTHHEFGRVQAAIEHLPRLP